ncbi:MAG TPA: hypothetical protein VHE80_08165 [Acidimicrobiales bacterium]|nr:hypothetical protein [Acidimicrobiales bacterium]
MFVSTSPGSFNLAEARQVASRVGNPRRMSGATVRAVPTHATAASGNAWTP